MTNTTPEAVERLSWSPTDMVQLNGHGSYVYYADYAALSAQLEAANERADTAHAQGKAEGLREAAQLIYADNYDDPESAGDAILALIPADTPAANVTVQEAANLILERGYDPKTVRDAMRDAKDFGCGPCDIFDTALRAIAGGRTDTPAANVTVQEAARVLLGDDGTVEDLAIQTMRNNRLIDGKRVGYYPALLAAFRAIAGGKDE